MLEEGRTVTARSGDLFTVVRVSHETDAPTLYELAPASNPDAGTVTVTADELRDLFTAHPLAR